MADDSNTKPTREPTPGVVDSPLVDDQGRVAADVTCPSCKYNLRGIAPEANCPECGMPVEHALAGDFLFMARPWWLRRLKFAMSVSLVGSAMLVGMPILQRSVSQPLADVLGGHFQAVAQVIEGAILFSPLMLLLFAVWCATTPEPRDVAYDRLSCRSLTRWCVVAVVALFTLFLMGDRELPSIALFLRWVLLWTGCIGYACFMTHLGGLAVRLANPRMVRSTRIVKWGMLLCWMIPMAFVMMRQLTSGQAGVLSIPAFVTLPCGVAWLALGIWSIYLMVAFRSEFHDAECRSKSFWTTGSKSPPKHPVPPERPSHHHPQS